MSGGVRGAGRPRPLLDSKYGPIRQCNDLLDCSTVLPDHGKLRRRCGGVCPLRSVMAMDFCPPSAWNGSCDDAPNNPSAVGAISAMDCAIGAASAYAACEHTSCKRQVIDSDLGGSQQARLAFF